MLATSGSDGRRPRPLRPQRVLRAVSSALTALRFLPIFTPRATLTRWRARRALRVAANEARDPQHDRRDWTSRFHLNGLTWHHLYISQDLRRMALFLRELHAQANRAEEFPVESMAAAVVKLERSYAYLVDNVWDVYNSLEKDVLFPWVAKGVPENYAVARALVLFGKERDRIEDTVDMLHNRFSRAVCSTGYAYSSMGPCRRKRQCASKKRRGKRRRERQDKKMRQAALNGESGESEQVRRKKANLQIREGYSPTEEEGKTAVGNKLRAMNPDEVLVLAKEMGEIIEDTERLHKTERGLLYPLIAGTFPEHEQARLTNVLVYSMRAALAKFTITIYHQAVEKHSARSQWSNYKKEVPLPIRVYTPVWRKRLFDDSPLGWLRTSKPKNLLK